MKNKNECVYINNKNVFCEHNEKTHNDLTASWKLEFLFISVAPTFCMIFALYLKFTSEGKFVDVLFAAALLFFIGGLLFWGLRWLLSKLDRDRILYSRSAFRDSVLLSAELVPNDGGASLEFKYESITYKVRPRKIPVHVQTGLHVPQFRGRDKKMDITRIDRPVDYLYLAIERNEPVSLLFKKQTLEVFLIGTPTLNVSEFIRKQNESGKTSP